MGKQATGAKCLRRGKASMKNKNVRYFMTHKGNNRKAQRKMRSKGYPGRRRQAQKREEWSGIGRGILQYHPYLPAIDLEKVGDIVKVIPRLDIHGRRIPREDQHAA